jgi:hypothetical protein
MTIYCVSARYRSRVRCNIPSDSPDCLEASDNNFKASDQFKDILGNLKLVNAHAYAWPDGSLYRYVEFDGTAEDLHQLITDQIPEDGYLTYIERYPGEIKPRVPEGMERSDFAISYRAKQYQEVLKRIERAKAKLQEIT